MDRYVIHGGRPLHGEIEISGAKNAAVAIIPAALMVDGVCRIENMPQISDVDMLLKILQGLGARVEYLSPSAVEIDCTQVRFTEPPYDLMRKIRASYYFIGSMLSRFGSAKTTMPGGCNFGVRPIDQHIKGMTAMGANVEVKNGFVYADTPDGRLRGAKVYLDKVSVGATMNIIIAATLARGRTVIENAARRTSSTLPTSSTPWAPTFAAPARIPSAFRVSSACTAARTASSPTRSRRARIWRPAPRPAGKCAWRM